ncbi:MAG: hypothetical protein IH851_09335 [Armatimonadetes bacterium]|nr:hypothetical protein [Armatimonadota bacterium]
MMACLAAMAGSVAGQASVSPSPPQGQAGQELDPYAFILSAVDRSLGEARLYLDMTGWEAVTGREDRLFRTQVWIQGSNLYVESHLNGNLRLSIVADGQKVWRYDAVANEYTFLSQPGTIGETLGLAVAWARNEAQRPLRLLARSPRWLVIPRSNVEPTFVEVWQTTGEGEKWRGTILQFSFDAPSPDGRMDRLEIVERFDTGRNGLREAEYTARFSYPASPFDFEFEFVPPKGAKPAADLPRRIGGG